MPRSLSCREFYSWDFSHESILRLRGVILGVVNKFADESLIQTFIFFRGAHCGYLSRHMRPVTSVCEISIKSRFLGTISTKNMAL